MTPQISIRSRPSLFVRVSRACPRCDSPQVRGLPRVAADSEFDWHECEACEHLWALPRQWPQLETTGGCR